MAYRLFTAALNFNHQNHGFFFSVYFSGLKVAPLFALSGVVLFFFRIGWGLRLIAALLILFLNGGSTQLTTYDVYSGSYGVAWALFCSRLRWVVVLMFGQCTFVCVSFFSFNDLFPVFVLWAD